MKNKKAMAEGYEELLSSIRKLIDDARVKGVPLFERDERLECAHCGAHQQSHFTDLFDDI